MQQLKIAIITVILKVKKTQQEYLDITFILQLHIVMTTKLNQLRQLTLVIMLVPFHYLFYRKVMKQLRQPVALYVGLGKN